MFRFVPFGFDEMFLFAYIYMEAVAAFNVSIDDMLNDEDFQSIREWNDIVQWKKPYFKGCRYVLTSCMFSIEIDMN